MEQTMNMMKRIVALAVVAVSITACQKQADSTPIRGGGTAPRAQGLPNNGSSTQNGITLNGYVWSNNETLFNELTKDFMAGSIDPQYVGWVSATAQNNTGVFFGGLVTSANGGPIAVTNVNQNMNNMQLNPGSQLLIEVYDYVPNQTNLAPLPPTYFTKLDVNQSYINGNQAKLHFYDDRGFVELTGTFDGTSFQGDFYFSTDVAWDGSQGGAGTLGSFKVPTCQFFRCQ